MRELNVMEVNAVSGAGFFDSVYSAAYMGVMGFATGAILGTKIGGGAGGGILGLGLLGEAVGVVVGAGIGVVSGAVVGGLVGWNSPETVSSLCDQAVANIVGSLASTTA